MACRWGSWSAAGGRGAGRDGADRLSAGFFAKTDPINREPEGSGVCVLNALGWGAVASLAGSLLFSLIMAAVGFLPTVAAIVHGTSPLLGFGVHLIIGALIGMS